MSRRDVLAQDVTAEVALQIAVHGVDVVGVVLRVVVFDQQRRAVHAVVVFLTAFDAACPGEVQLFEARTLEARESVLRGIGVQPAGVQLDQPPQLLLLGRVHVGGCQPFDGERSHLRIIARDDVRERRVRDCCRLAMCRREQRDEFAPEILFRRQQPESGLRATEHARGIRADEHRRHDGRLTGKLGHIDRKMMALETPAPGRGRARRAEHAGVIETRIAPRRVDAGFGLHPAQNVFVLHDAARREQALGAQGGGEQRPQFFALRVVELQ